MLLKIGNAEITDIGRRAFKGCDDLTVTVKSGTRAEECCKKTDLKIKSQQ